MVIGMRAIVYREFGSPDVLRLEDVEKPVPRDDEVLVAVHAAAVNTFDWYMVRGKPFFFRLVLGRGRPKPLGVDLASLVEAVGRNVTRFKPGDDVFGTGRDKSVRSKRGSFAEYGSVGRRRLRRQRLSSRRWHLYVGGGLPSTSVWPGLISSTRQRSHPCGVFIHDSRWTTEVRT
jgi:hypothetical protein